MSLEEQFAEFRTAIDAEIARARGDAVTDLVSMAARVRGASTEADRTAALEEVERLFPQNSAVVAFLKTLAPVPVLREDKHLRAQRFARVRVAEIQLYHAAAMKSGRAAGDVYGALKAQIDAAREAYRESFLTPVKGTADYLHTEFVRTLANDDAALLGSEYPGPLV